MTRISDLSSALADVGLIERALGNSSFQRAFSIFTSVIGVLLTIGTFLVWTLMPEGRYGPAFSWITLDRAMTSLANIMLLLMLLTTSLLGLYLSMRGLGRPLARLLAVSCGSLAISFGAFNFQLALRDALPLGKREGLTIVLESDFFSTLLVLAVVILIGVWMFSTLKFLLFFPKSVRLTGVDLGPANQSLLQIWRNRKALRVWIGDFNWRSLVSPQCAALTAGIAMIILVNAQGECAYADFFSDTTRYLWCWIPWAIVSVKQKHVGDEDQRAIRWVTFGQSVWLAAFLVSLVLILLLTAVDTLKFPNMKSHFEFIDSFMSFSFLGFVTVLLATLAFSILYHGTLDPDLVIRRTWVVALVGGSSGMLFISIERLAAGMLTRWFEVSSGTAFTLVGVFTAVCVFPLRAWAERLIKSVGERWQSTYLLADGVRKEAVVVFADLSGYTALTEKSEREALILAAIFHQVAKRIAEAHRGRLIKTIGDAVMLRFSSVDDAYNSTRKLIEEYTNHAKPLVNEPLPIHAAIHRGEVVEGVNGDVFGATVNLAARLLNVAGPHEVVASESAAAMLSPPTQTQLMGSRAFKNVEKPVTCFRLVPG